MFRAMMIMVCGLALNGAAPPSEEAKPIDKGEAALESIAGSLAKANGPKELEAACEAGENRSSDLCAQWKAADAANSASIAAWATTVVGLLTLSAAFGAAKWAREAAKAGQEANSIARDFNHRQLRPFVGFGRSQVDNIRIGSAPIFTVEIDHAGLGPALHIQAIVDFFLLEPDQHDAPVHFKPPPAGSPSPRSRTQMLPGHPGVTATRQGQILTEEVFQRLKSQQQRYLCAGIISYRDIFGRRYFTTFKSVTTNFINSNKLETGATFKGNVAS